MGSGSSLRVGSERDLTPEEQEQIRTSKDPSDMMTANGTTHTTEEASDIQKMLHRMDFQRGRNGTASSLDIAQVRVQHSRLVLKKWTYVLQVESREQRFFTSCENFGIDLIHCGLRKFMSKSELTLEEPKTFRTSMDPSVIMTASRTTHTT